MMRLRTTSMFMLTACALLWPAVMQAQTSQKLSVQLSALFADMSGDNFSAIGGGLGVELQLRYTPSAFSLGGGVQYSHHNDVNAERDGHEGAIDLLGVFVEPRYSIYVGSERVAPYLSARLAYAQMDLWNDFSSGEKLSWKLTGVTVNAGGGILMRVNPRMNLDLGATAGYTNYPPGEGEIDGQPFDIDLGSGTNLVLRAGLAIGLGR